MASTDDHLLSSASLRLRLVGREIDRIGVNLHQLGRSLLSCQELVNVAANETIKRDIPVEEYQLTTVRGFQRRRFFLQGHLADVNKGSLDLLIPLIAQPELRVFLTSENFRSFAISVVANLFTSATLVLAGRRRKPGTQSQRADGAEQKLAVLLAPQLEKLARCVTLRSGIDHIDLTIEETGEGLRIKLRVDRGSRDHILDFAEVAPASDTNLIGEIRSIDLDQRRATLLEDVTGNRTEFEYLGDPKDLKDHLGHSVEVPGKIRPRVDRRGGVRNRIHVETITPLEQLKP